MEGLEPGRVRALRKRAGGTFLAKSGETGPPLGGVRASSVSLETLASPSAVAATTKPPVCISQVYESIFICFHPLSPLPNRSHPLQHPERTRFRLFLAESGAFSFSRCFSGAKFLDWFLCILPYSDHRLKPSVIPCRREDPPRCVQPAYCNSPCLCYTKKVRQAHNKNSEF